MQLRNPLIILLATSMMLTVGCEPVDTSTEEAADVAAEGYAVTSFGVYTPDGQHTSGHIYQSDAHSFAIIEGETIPLEVEPIDASLIDELGDGSFRLNADEGPIELFVERVADRQMTHGVLADGTEIVLESAVDYGYHRETDGVGSVRQGLAWYIPAIVMAGGWLVMQAHCSYQARRSCGWRGVRYTRIVGPICEYACW